MHSQSSTKTKEMFFTDAAVWPHPSYRLAATPEMRAIDAWVSSTERSSHPAKSV